MIWLSLFDITKQKEFLDYYQRRASHNQYVSALSMESFVRCIDKISAGQYQFSIPRKITINKINSKKKRIVYCYQQDEMLFLRYVNFILSRLELGIDCACYSFRPGSKVKEIFHQIRQLPEMDKLEIIKVDITDFYNSIPMENLEWLPKEIKEDLRLLDLLRRIYLSEWVREGTKAYKCPKKGIMAGLPICGTLSNLYLREFDQIFRNSSKAYFRYSDDMIFFVEKGRGVEVFQEIQKNLKQHGLEVNQEKTAILSADEKWEFLGIEYNRGKFDLSEVTLKKIKGKIRRAARSLYRWKVKKNIANKTVLMVFVRKFNRKFYGYGSDEQEFTWSKWYFSMIDTAEKLREIDHYFQEYGRYLSSGRFQKKNYHRIQYQDFIDCGYKPLVSAYYQGDKGMNKNNDFN